MGYVLQGIAKDHNLPHFYAEYNVNKALLDIVEARLLKGVLSS